MPEPRVQPGDARHDPDPRGAFRREILPLLAGYWAFGQYWGAWVILVFEFQRAHDLSDSRLGVDYTALSLVAVGVMLFVAPRLQPLALAASVPLALAALGGAAIAIAYLPTGAILLGFALVGVGNALIDVYLNVAAQRVEARRRRPALQWLHASYAFGGVTGAAGAGVLRALDLDHRLGIALTGVALLAAAAWNLRTAPRERPPPLRETFSLSALRRWPRLWVPALVVLFAFLVEGSMDTWSGLYLREELGASAGAAALAFVAFAGATCLGRVFAGKVLFGLGHRTTILVAGAGSAAGGLLAVLTSNPAVVGLAFLLLGFALSAAGPAGFGLVAGDDVDPTSAVTAVTTVGYTGFVWSPSLLGWIADTASLRAAMGVIVAATVGIVAVGLLAPRKASVPDPG